MPHKASQYLFVHSDIEFDYREQHYEFKRVLLCSKGVYGFTSAEEYSEFVAGECTTVTLTVCRSGNKYTAPCAITIQEDKDCTSISLRFLQFDISAHEKLKLEINQYGLKPGHIRRKPRFLFVSDVSIITPRFFSVDWKCSNISESGVLIYRVTDKKEHLEINEIIEGKLFNNDTRTIIPFQAKVVRSMKLGINEVSEYVDAYGLEFINFEFSKIKKYLGKLLD